MKSQRVTMRTVADEAGVSVQTVSRVLNNHPDVAESTARRIQKVIDRLNYTPNEIARSLIQQQSYTIGVAIDVIEGVGPASILAGISYEAELNDFCLLVKRIPEANVELVDSVLQVMLSRQVDGIIWAVPEIGDNHNWVAEKSKTLGVPIVYITMSEREGLVSISMNNFKGGCMATQHLLDQGYQHIAHISGPRDWWEARERRRGWEDTLKAAGMSSDDRQWREVDRKWSAHSTEAAFLDLLEKYPEMDAVFVASDQMALKVLQVAQKEGLRIPQDLGVIGYDGIEEAAYYFPALSTINHDHINLGIQSVKALIQSLERSSASKKSGDLLDAVLFEPGLVVRESSFAG